jgi:hypothetical protein
MITCLSFGIDKFIIWGKREGLCGEDLRTDCRYCGVWLPRFAATVFFLGEQKFTAHDQIQGQALCTALYCRSPVSSG